MGDEKMIKERRRGFFSHVIDVFSGRQGRKVAFGIWGFIAANAFLAEGRITADIWWKCFLTCMLLIGFGTIMDSIVAKLGDAASLALGNRAASLIGGKKNADNPPQPPQT